MSRNAILTVLVSMLILYGCSQSTSPVNTSLSPPDTRCSAQSPNRVVWGLWNITLSPDRSDVRIIPDRFGAMHFNCVRLLEVNPCDDCLRVHNLEFTAGNILQLEMELIHPFPGMPKLSGFDVRGILVSEGDYTFPSSGRTLPIGTGVPHLINPDGYTSLFNPTDFPEDAPGFPALKYITGKYAPGGDLTATLNGYIAYKKNQPRRVFIQSGNAIETIQVYLPDGINGFGYAVDACWQFVDGPVTDPVADFPPDANCLEAYKLNVTIGDGLSLSTGGMADVAVEVFDHQGLDTVSTVTIEAPDLFAGSASLDYSTQTGEESWLFSGMIHNDLYFPQGTTALLIRVTDTESDPNLGPLDAWEYTTIHVGTLDGWARTWGGPARDTGIDLCTASNGDIIVVGCFLATVDFDPGSGIDEHTSGGYGDAYMSRFNPDGYRIWTKTWGNELSCGANAVVLDNDENIYVAGGFSGSVDFDPGNGVKIVQGEGFGNFFISSFTPDGDFTGVQTFGKNGTESAWNSIASMEYAEPGNIFMAGIYSCTTDFDPGPGEFTLTCNGLFDTYMSKFSPDGEFLWASSFGGQGADMPYAITVFNTDSVYITGEYEETVDFYPGPEIDEHTSNGMYDTFLLKMTTDGTW